MKKFLFFAKSTNTNPPKETAPNGKAAAQRVGGKFVETKPGQPMSWSKNHLLHSHTIEHPDPARGATDFEEHLREGATKATVKQRVSPAGNPTVVHLHQNDVNEYHFVPASMSKSIGDKPISKEQYLADAHRNLMATSRTANGNVDTSASANKAKEMAVGSGDEAKHLAQKNFTDTMERLHSERNKKFADHHELLAHVDNINRQVNRGITKAGSFLRKENSTKYNYTPVGKMDEHRHEFAKEFHQRLDRDDPKDTAAWLHHKVNHTGHYYADGVGKTTEALTNWVHMRHNHPLPTYRSRDEMFEHAKDHETFRKYYHSLFPGKEDKPEMKKSLRFILPFNKSLGEAAPAHDSEADSKNGSTPSSLPQSAHPTPDDVWISRHKDENGEHVYTHAGQEFRGKNASEDAYNAMRKKFPKADRVPPHPKHDLGGAEESHLQHSDGKGNYTPERSKIHRQILDHFLHHGKQSPASSKFDKHREDEQPHAIFMTGGSGSGKGFVKNHVYGKHEDLVNIDPDDIKEHLAKHDGKAGDERHHPQYWHEESSELSKRLQHEAHAHGKSYIFDGVGDNAEKMKKKMNHAVAAGHQIHARRVDTDLKTAWYRNVTRPRTVLPHVLHHAHEGSREAWPEVAAHAEKHGGSSAVFKSESGPDSWHDGTIDDAMKKSVVNKLQYTHNMGRRGINMATATAISDKPQVSDGQKCKIEIDANTVFVGHVAGGNFIMDDKISNGSSWRALTHKRPAYKPIPMEEFEGHKITVL